jgi:hypothetical protein
MQGLIEHVQNKIYVSTTSKTKIHETQYYLVPHVIKRNKFICILSNGDDKNQRKLYFMYLFIYFSTFNPSNKGQLYNME